MPSKKCARKFDGSQPLLAQGARVEWEHVLGALDDEKALSTALARIQALENKGVREVGATGPAAALDRNGAVFVRGPEPLTSVKDFQVSRKARENVCDALTYTEDWLEYEHKRKVPLRDAIARVRRALEAELWP